MSAACIAVLALALGSSTTRVAGQSGAPPILLVVNSAAPNPFGSYLAEILRAEGVQSFSTVQLSSVTAATLSAARLVVLAETPLTAPQATLFTNYVSGGGRLVAMRPDTQLAALFGISALVPTTTNGYVLVNQSGPGAGLQSMTLPYKGVASNYALAGATEVAALYSSRTTAVGLPAVVTYGRTAAWSFDLARSTAYSRQGDPAYAGQERDGIPILRTTDIFFNNIDLQRVGVPHADVQMRLFSRVIAQLLADSQPLPRLWYFPGTATTMFLPTADTHTSTVAPYQALIASAEAKGARVTLYLSRYVTIPPAAGTWRANGHELGLHPFMSSDNATFAQGYQTAQTWFSSTGFAPPSATVRHHSVEWAGWTDPLPTMIANGIRLDTSYYPWGPTMYNTTKSNQAHGYVTGSGLPMRFVSSTGTVYPVYQQTTTLVDEQMVVGDYAELLTPAQALAVSRQIIDDSQAGGYSAVTAQFHVDYYTYGEVQPWVDGTMAYAQSLSIPMWTAERWLKFNEARAATTVANLAWSAQDKALTFDVTVPAGAEAQTVLVPANFGGDAVTSVIVNGVPATAPAFTVNGQTMRAVSISAAGGAARSVAVLYAVATPSISINDITVTEGNTGASTATLTVTLSAPTSNPVSVAFQTANGTALAGSDYTATSGTLNFAPFQTTQTVPVSILGDLNLEPSESLSVVLSTPTNATIADSVGIITITDDDAPPAITVADVTVTEGNSGTTPATFVLSIAGARGYPVTVQYATANGTATAGADYTAGSGTVTFPAGSISQSVVIPVVADTVAEPDETFVLNLSNATNGVIADNQAVATIVNDDSGTATINATFQVAAGGDDVNEESGGFTSDAATVWLGNASAAATSWGGFRFTGVTIPPGATITSARLEVQAASTQWLSLNFDFGMEASANSAAFSAGSKPSQRPLVAQHVAHASDAQWVSGTWYQLDQLSALLQSVISQPGWASGNAASIVVHGSGAAWARKFANAFESAPASAPRLVVTYTIQQAAPPALSVSDVTLPEGNSGSTNAVFSVSLSAASAQTVTVDYATADGTATAGSDYAARSGTLTFAPGATTQQVSVPVTGDTTFEPNETFTLTLTGPNNATIGDGTGVATITNDDSAQSLSIADVAVAEGNTGTTPATFTVTLTPPSGQTVTVNYATAGGTATPGADFTAASGALTFAPGVVSQTIPVAVIGDTLNEPDETFTVVLSNPTNAAITTGTAVGTITNDDPQPALAIDDVTTPEGNSGSSGTATFTLTLSAASGQAVSVHYATANGTAIAGSDYTAASGTVTFAPGVTAQTVAIALSGDALSEADETFSVNLSAPVNATIDDASGLGTIANDDGTPALSVDDVTVTEGQTGTSTATFTVSLAAASAQTISVTYATADGTAAAGSDYTAASGTLTFAPGVTTQQVPVTVLGDVLAEQNETFTITLGTPVNATIADATGVGTITNDDGAATLAIDDVTVAEGNAGSAAATFTVTLSPASGDTVTVAYSTANGTAAAGSDYTAASGTLTFAPGVTTQTIVVVVSGDTLPEANETFSVTLSAPVNAAIGDGLGAGTITNDDGLPALAIGDVTLAEGDAPGVNAVLTVTLSAASGQTVTVGYATANQTATAGVDYTATSGTLTFQPGQLTQAITVPVLSDTYAEPDETFAVTLSTPVGAVVGVGTATATLTNDDTTPALSIDDVTVTEGQAGQSSATFTVTLSLPSPVGGITVDFATADGTATAGSDYAGGTGTVTFGPNVATQTIVVPIAGDTAFEAAETFTVTLSHPTGATLLDASGTGTITNDDPQPAIAIDDVTVAEGDAGAANATFTVSLSAASSLTTTVAYTTVDGTAAAGSDFSGASGTLTFAPGVTTQTVAVPVLGDTLFEPSENFTVVLSAPTNASLADPSGLGTISNDDAAPSISIGSATVAEGNSGTTSALFTVTLSAPSAQAASVDYVATAGTATAAADFTAASGTVTFAPGVTAQTIAVPVLGDTVAEPDETFSVQLSAPVGATIASGTGAGTITNDDAAPVVNIGDATVAEGNAGSANAVFSVTLSNASSQAVTVDFATVDGTAVAGSDFTAATGTLTFVPGVTAQTVTVAVTGDTLAEATESFTVVLSNAANATLGDASGLGTITNDDALPTIAIGDATVAEGDIGTTTATFTVSLSAASAQTVTVAYATADGTAAAGSDYTAGSGTVTFAPGVTSQTVTVAVNGDLLNEANETFTVGLANALNATLADGSGLGTITNDDAAPAFSVTDVTVAEGNAGTTSAVFTVTLSAPSGLTATVAYATANGTATAGTDFTAATGTLTFAPGVTSQTVTVAVTGDILAEADETFTLGLSNATGATIADASGLGTITNDDVFPTLNVSDVSVAEGNTGTRNAAFTVTLSAASAQTVTAAYATANGTATAGSDYTAASGTVTLAAGVTSQTVNVVVAGDTLAEANETFTLTLSSPVNAVIGDGLGVGTITNDDGVPNVSVNSVTVTEGNTGSVNATFTITLSAVSGSAVTVAYATADGTATAGADYTATAGTATIAAGATSTTVVVPVLGDVLDEANETFTLGLSSPLNATILTGTGTGTITDNDVRPSLAIADVTTTEGAGTTAVFTVTLSAASGRQVTVNYATSNGTATSTSDYTSTSGTLTFAAGVTSRTVTVPIVNNALNEATETFNLVLSSATNATIADTTGVATVLDDDPLPSIAIADASVVEPNALTTTITFTVTLSAASGRSVSVSYATANGTATAGSDYVAKTGTVTIAAGATSATFTVTVNGDVTVEPNETFVVNLSSPTNGTIADGQAVGTIINND